MKEKNFYELLGVAATAPTDAIKTAYQERVNRYATQMNAASRDFDYHRRELDRAYATLGNPELRAEYNQTIGIG